MKLYQPVLDKIKLLGETQASEYFGKSRQTLYTWQKNPNKIPLVAVQQVAEEVGLQLRAKDLPGLPEDLVDKPPEQQVGEEKGVFDGPPVVDQMWSEQVNNRLDRLEDFARSQTDPDRSDVTRSMTRPSPNQPVVVVGGTQPTKEIEFVKDAEIPKIGQVEQSWNKPYTPKK